MSRDHFTLVGVEHIEARIRHHAKELAYLMVWDRSDRSTEETVGRFEMEDRNALPYLEDTQGLPSEYGAEPVEPADHGWDDQDRENDEHEQGTELAQAAEDGREESYLTSAQLADAGCRWLRALAMRCTVAEEYRRFRVRLYSVKGMRVLDSGSFMCRNDDWEIQIAPRPAPKREIPKPSFEDAAAEGGAKAMRELGHLYAQWGNIVIGSVDQLQGVNNSMNAQLHRQLRDARDQVDQLVAAILEYRHKQALSSDERERDEREDDTRAMLARDAINQLGEAARAFLATRGLSPEMAEVLGMLGNSPELSAALADPDVRTLMQDPENLKGLAAMLRQAAIQARAAEQAGQPDQAQAQAQAQAQGDPTDPHQPNPHQPATG